jgi:3-dehydroquinate synthase
MVETFEVRTKSRWYNVHVGVHLLKEIGAYIAHLAERVFVVTDDVLSHLYLRTLLDSLEENHVESITEILPAGESSKTLENAKALYNHLATHFASRSDAVLALGGGVIGDIAGFVAATFKRGMVLVQVPTTLLAQVDSAVGGKTAVNMHNGKNLVGTFYQPHEVIADVSTLRTLTDDAFTAGLAEVIKYGAIMDSGFLKVLKDNRNTILEREPVILTTIIESCLRHKASIVENDEREEKRGREILNFGHTIGHAIETCSGHQILHGFAVSIGMAEEARFAVKRGLLDDQSLEVLISILSMFGLPTEIPTNLDPEDLNVVIKQDKKMRGGRLLLPMLTSIGKIELTAVPMPHNLIS